MKRLSLFLLFLASSVALGQAVFVNDEGTLRELSGIFVNDGGTLRDIQEGWINDSGTLRQFFTAIVLSGGDGGTVQQNDNVASYGTRVGIRFRTDGTVETGKGIDYNITWTAGGGGAWIDPVSEASSGYDVRFTNCTDNSGNGMFTQEASAEDAWIAISTIRAYVTLETSWAVPINFNCDFEVRTNAGAPPNTGSSNWAFEITNS